jgi:signal transduction histidine kinase
MILLYTVSERRGFALSLLALGFAGVLFFPTQYHRNAAGGYAAFGDLPSLIEGTYPYLVLAWFAGRAQARRMAIRSELDAAVRELEEERERLSRAAVRAERSRIARDLHTLVIRGVQDMNAESHAARTLLRTDPTQVSASIGAVELRGRTTLVEMRRLMMVLRAGDGAVNTSVESPIGLALTDGSGAASGHSPDGPLSARARRSADQRFADWVKPWIDFPWIADGLLVLALALMAVSEPLVGLRWPTLSWRPFIPLVLIAVSALLLRRRFPLVVLAILTIEVFITNAFLGQGSPPYTVDRSMFVAVYTVAVAGGPAWGIAGLAAEVTAYAPLLFVRPQIWFPYDLAGWSAMFLFVVIGGLAVRSARRLNTELQDQSELLRRTREERVRLAVAEERARVARDMHDVVGHGLTVMVVQAGAARALAERHPERADEALVLVEETGQDAIRELSSVLNDLGVGVAESSPSLPRPEHRDVASLVDHAIDAGLRVTLHIEGDRGGGSDPGLEMALFRIVQEALTNVRKHAPAARAWVEIRYSSDGVEVDVTDSGDPAKLAAPVVPGAGQGLVGIAERATLFGGESDAGPTPDGGFRVRARLRAESVRV